MIHSDVLFDGATALFFIPNVSEQEQYNLARDTWCARYLVENATVEIRLGYIKNLKMISEILKKQIDADLVDKHINKFKETIL